MTDHPANLDQDTDDDLPPILGSWRNMYILVIVLHFILIGIFYWFTRLHA